MQIQLVRLSDQIPLCREALTYVSAERRHKISRMVQKDDKKRSLIAELLIRAAASKQLNMPFESIRIKRSPYGKPYIDNVRHFRFSVSHSGEYVALAVSRCRVGIDVERAVPIDMKIASRFFTSGECQYLFSLNNELERQIAFFKLWTLKESYTKAEGKGLLIPLNSMEFDVRDKPCLLAGRHSQRYRFFSECMANNKYAISLCHMEKNPAFQYSVINEEKLYSDLLST